MSKKMNWDKTRIQNRIARNGAQYVGSDGGMPPVGTVADIARVAMRKGDKRADQSRTTVRTPTTGTRRSDPAALATKAIGNGRVVKRETVALRQSTLADHQPSKSSSIDRTQAPGGKRFLKEQEKKAKAREKRLAMLETLVAIPGTKRWYSKGTQYQIEVLFLIRNLVATIQKRDVVYSQCIAMTKARAHLANAVRANVSIPTEIGASLKSFKAMEAARKRSLALGTKLVITRSGRQSRPTNPESEGVFEPGKKR